jgi:hypothetical protein
MNLNRLERAHESPRKSNLDCAQNSPLVRGLLAHISRRLKHQLVVPSGEMTPTGCTSEKECR